MTRPHERHPHLKKRGEGKVLWWVFFRPPGGRFLMRKLSPRRGSCAPWLIFCAVRKEPSKMPRFVDSLLFIMFALLALSGLIVILRHW